MKTNDSCFLFVLLCFFLILTKNVERKFRIKKKAEERREGKTSGEKAGVNSTIGGVFVC